MRNAGRAIAIVVAVALAAVATFAITTYIRGIEQRAFEDAELVEVFVANERIPGGIPAAAAAEAGVIERRNVPRRSIPDGVVTSLDQIDGLVALDPILSGEILVRERWGDAAAARAQLDIPEGFQAVSVQVGIPPGVAGFVSDGDRVSLVAHVTGTTEEAEEGEVETADETRAQYLLQDIEVLSTSRRVPGGDEDGGDAITQEGGQVLLTVALQPEDVERLVFAINEANLYFTLLPEDAAPQDTPGRTFENLFQ